MHKIGDAHPQCVNNHYLNEDYYSYRLQKQDKEVVASFCYLGDMLSAGGGCEMAVTTGERTKAHWDKSPLGQKPTGQYPTGQKPTA